jgi:hypothetical protein
MYRDRVVQIRSDRGAARQQHHALHSRVPHPVDQTRRVGVSGEQEHAADPLQVRSHGVGSVQIANDALHDGWEPRIRFPHESADGRTGRGELRNQLGANVAGRAGDENHRGTHLRARLRLFSTFTSGKPPSSSRSLAAYRLGADTRVDGDWLVLVAVLEVEPPVRRCCALRACHRRRPDRLPVTSS